MADDSAGTLFTLERMNNQQVFALIVIVHDLWPLNLDNYKS